MEITREVILQRIAQLREQREALAANINALNGAIQMNEEWLAALEIAQIPVAEEGSEA
jgi:hypothetical protein